MSVRGGVAAQGAGKPGHGQGGVVEGVGGCGDGAGGHAPDRVLWAGVDDDVVVDEQGPQQRPAPGVGGAL
ncbi:hypothetical protein [Nocardia vaccinii]|uniref:hypothetical protein n=1 Tax=Nocardia vaccinii TaxID=1822 RepID=UPI0012F4930D|nr:hypothetical protein [Nocardia vaccinii]